MLPAQSPERSAAYALALDRGVAIAPSFAMRGKVVEAIGILVKATGFHARIGETCKLTFPDGGSAMSEVVGFSKTGILLLPFHGLPGLSAATQVVPQGHAHSIAVGDALLGRVLDGFGEPMDGLGSLNDCRMVSVHASPPSPLKRRPINRALHSGVRAIDSLLTVGEGQRVGIFAPAGAGKSTLLGMLARNSSADINVIALIGERGREVREFMDHTLGAEGLKKSVCVITTSDRTAIERTRAAHVATAIAEYFRDQGKSVLLIMDSLTRFARGQRDIGLASGEPPTRRGFPPSLFAELPRLLERAGQGERGSITAFYTVLMEDEQTADPVAEEARSILDGHIILSQRIAARSQYPAIDILSSVSRVMPQVSEAKHMANAMRTRKLIAKFDEIELLVQIGEYKTGSDRLGDEALRARPAIMEMLSQRISEDCAFEVTLGKMAKIAEVTK